MEMKVRLLDGTEEKGTAQVEQELLEKHEQQFQNVNIPGQQQEQEQEQQLKSNNTMIVIANPDIFILFSFIGRLHRFALF